MTQGSLKVYNTMSMQKEPFKTITAGKVSMFVCGPTVQSFMHIGHARTYIFYDLVARYLSHLGYEVNFLMNITDVDENVALNAKIEGISPELFADRYTKAFLEDVTNLRILTVTNFARVSNYIPEMVNQISTLIKKGNAYVVNDEVYFDVNTYPDYGKLSHLSRSELTLRPIDISLKKRDVLDFALWRSTSLERRWKSPWGLGTPGWHIQDTAVTITNFGYQYDIHGGAYELIYPHHESEVAQAESLTGVKPFVTYWIHTGLVTKEGKMSRSEGNVYNVRDILSEHEADCLRLYFFSHHYRKNMEFDEKDLRKVGERYSIIKEKAKTIEENRSARIRRRDSNKLLMQFYDALNDDFDTPKAINLMVKLIDDGVGERDPNRIEAYYESLKMASNILGVDLFGQRSR
jgi:cysteinyl-tRNA synthetase